MKINHHLRIILKSIILSSLFLSFSFTQLHHGIGFQITSDGAGLSYEIGRNLNRILQVVGEIGLHFDETSQSLGQEFYGWTLSNSYNRTFINTGVGFKRELLTDKIAGSFKPIISSKIGIVANTDPISFNRIREKLALGIGIRFINGSLLNEVIWNYQNSPLINGNMALQWAIFWN